MFIINVTEPPLDALMGLFSMKMQIIIIIIIMKLPGPGAYVQLRAFLSHWSSNVVIDFLSPGGLCFIINFGICPSELRQRGKYSSFCNPNFCLVNTDSVVLVYHKYLGSFWQSVHVCFAVRLMNCI